MASIVFDDENRSSEDDPHKTIELYRKGSGLAKDLGETWWQYLYDVWIAIFLVDRIGDLHNGLRQALFVVNEGGKGSLQLHPWRTAATNMLVACYIGIDPIGYADAIRKCLRELRKEIPRSSWDDRLVYMNYQTDFYKATGKFLQAEKVALRSLAIGQSYQDHCSETGDWYLIEPVLALCWTSYQRKDFIGMSTYAQQAVQMSKHEPGKRNGFAEALAWQAIAARLRGDEKEARSLFRSSRNRSSRSKVELSPEHYDALSFFHEASGDLAKAIDIRNRQLLGLADKGRLGQECDVLLKRGELMARLGRFSEADVAPILKALDLVKNPVPYQKRLKKILKS